MRLDTRICSDCILEIDMSEEEKEFLLDEERAQKAFDALVKYLALSARSEKECKEKLYGKGYHRNEVEYAVEKAKKYNYINDEEYVRTYLMFNSKRYGAKKIAYKLTTEKGVDKKIVDDILSESKDEQKEYELALSMAQKYAKTRKIQDKSGAQKISAHLYSKGFDFGIINKVVANMFDVFSDN